MPLTNGMFAGPCNRVESCMVFQDRGKQTINYNDTVKALNYARWFVDIAPRWRCMAETTICRRAIHVRICASPVPVAGRGDG